MSYIWPGMKKISYEEAIKCFEDELVYLLYDDDTEAAVDGDKEEAIRRIDEHHKYGGEFGIEKEDNNEF
jgi:hypothetical protein